MPTVSVTQLIEPAITFTKKMLFTRPFSLKKWIKLAIIAWLAGEAFVGGGGGGGFHVPAPSGDSSSHRGIQPFSDFLQQGAGTWQYLLDHIFLIILIIAIGFTFLIAVCLIFAYLRALFSFIFLESLATNQVLFGSGFVKFQWHGWRLFFFRLIFGLLFFLIVFLVIGIPIILLLLSLGSIEELKTVGWVTLFLTILGIIIVLLPIIIVVTLFNSFTNNFVIPTMYLHHFGVIPAWKRYWQTLRIHVWDTVRFILMKFVLGIAGGIIAVIVVLLTLIPFAMIGLIIGGTLYLILSFILVAVSKIAILIGIGGFTVLLLLFPWIFVIICLLLPLAVFFRVYTLLFLGICDPELTVLKEKQPERKFPEYPWRIADTPSTS